jgi:hypothetical protein
MSNFEVIFVEWIVLRAFAMENPKSANFQDWNVFISHPILMHFFFFWRSVLLNELLSISAFIHSPVKCNKSFYIFTRCIALLVYLITFELLKQSTINQKTK